MADTTVTESKTSSDGRYTLVVNQIFFEQDEMADFSRGKIDVYLTDNTTNQIKSLYQFEGYTSGVAPYIFFSPDSKNVVFQLPGEYDFGQMWSPHAHYSYDIESDKSYQITQFDFTPGKPILSDDGSKVTWSTYDSYWNVVEGVFYFPSVGQFALPSASGDKVNSTGSGVLVVGDTVFIKLKLEGIKQEFNQQNITLTLSSGGTAAYDSTLSRPGEYYVFKYIVQADQFDKNLSISSVNLNGATLLDRDGESAVISKDLSVIKGTLTINGYIGSAGNENFSGTAGADRLEGRAGDDTYRVNHYGDQIIEAVGGGNDTVVTTISYTLAAKQEIEIFRVAKSEGSANINLTGNDLSQTLEGNSGNNIIDGRKGADYMRGFRGDDTYYVDNSGDFVREIARQGNDTVIASVSYSLAAEQEIETLKSDPLLNRNAINLTGNEFVNTLIGNDASNILNGGGGRDTLIGGKGNDTYIVDNAGDRVVEVAKEGVDTVLSSVSYTLAAGQEIEAMQLLSSTGTAALNLTGNEFAQTLRGNGGTNLLDGKGGADAMYGGGGFDTYAVDNAGDRVFEGKGQGYDLVVSTVTWALAAGQEVEAVQLAKATGSKALNLTGNEFAQTLRGNAGVNILDGKGGADTMVGLSGNDTYVVDDARDQVIEARGQGSDTVIATTGYTLAAGQEIEILQLAKSTGFANFDLTGNAFANTLRGNSGNNVLDGRDGADVLVGGAGQDAFVFSTKLGSGNVDHITDFAPVDDTVRLSDDVFTKLAAGPLPGSVFKDISVSGTVIDRDDRLIYDRRDGKLYYDTNGSDAGERTLIAVFDNHAKLTHDDFFVV